MVLNQKMIELVFEYKLLRIQAQVHAGNGHIDKYIDCLDMLTKTEKEIRECLWKLFRETFLRAN